MRDYYLVWIFAGEASGDLYGARLASELRQLPFDKPLRIAGMGSREMRKAGVELMVDSSELGIVGLIEVFKHIFTFIRIFLRLRSRAIKERPDAVILIDYPGFNLRFARQMHKNGIPVIWYVSPQVWVWGKGRIPKLAEYCTKMMVIFPFETEVYKGTGLDVEFVGHPLIQIISDRTDVSFIRDPSKVVLLPGSRGDEVRRLLPDMLGTAVLLHKRRPDLKYVISTPRNRIYDQCAKMVGEFCDSRRDEKLPQFTVTCGETSKWLQEGGTGLAASGTVTVECAIAGLPLVVIYRVNPITFTLGKLVIKRFYRDFFTMVNIIANKTVFKEYIQEAVDPEILCDELEKILPGGERRAEVEEGMALVAQMLSSGSVNASRKAAESVMKTMMDIQAPTANIRQND